MKCIRIVLISVYFVGLCSSRPQDEQSTELNEQQTDETTETTKLSEIFNTVTMETNAEKKAAHCGRPNKAGLNRYGLEFLSSSLSKSGEFPWIVAIMKKLMKTSGIRTLLYSGSGSLIHPSVILTAVHEHYSFEDAIVRAGEWDFSNEFEMHPSQDRVISRVHVIDVFDANTVQLLFVSEPFDLTPNIQTVCLPMESKSIMDRNDCITAAWGQQSCSGTKGLHSIQGHTELSVWSERNTCEMEWQQYLEDDEFKLENHHFCTVRKNNREESCFCDHGAALFCANESDSGDIRYEQIGVALANSGCKRDLPGIYANVSLYKHSIDEIFELNYLDKSYYES